MLVSFARYLMNVWGECSSLSLISSISPLSPWHFDSILLSSNDVYLEM
jgi:hypothetical protein